MADTIKIETPEAAEALPAGTWVGDDAGNFWCLVDTHMGWLQRMAMDKSGRSYTALDGLPYPLYEAELNGECKHSRGSNEMGHCRRCGAIVVEPRPMIASDEQLELIRTVAELNARNAQ